jgi:hypothetical protein
VAYCGDQLGVADLVPTAVSGQQHDHALVDPLDQLVRPATSLSEGAGGTASVQERRVGQIRMPAAVETEVVTAQIEGELELLPCRRRNQGPNAMPPASAVATEVMSMSFAVAHGIGIHPRSSFTDEPGTWIRRHEHAGFEGNASREVAGIAHRRREPLRV